MLKSDLGGKNSRAGKRCTVCSYVPAQRSQKKMTHANHQTDKIGGGGFLFGVRPTRATYPLAIKIEDKILISSYGRFESHGIEYSFHYSRQVTIYFLYLANLHQAAKLNSSW